MICQVLKRPLAPDLAYTYLHGDHSTPVVLFLSGYRGDRTGAKATALASHTASHTRLGLVMFDYRGHGESGGIFTEATLKDWADDAADILTHVVPPGRPVIIVGSSMGGWLGLHLLTRVGDPRLQALVGIAAAPDFTRDIRARLSPNDQVRLTANGRISIPGKNPSDDPYDLGLAFFESGEALCLLDQDNTHVRAPIILMQGRLDKVVSSATPDLIIKAYPMASVTVDRIEGGDHNLSRPSDMARLYDHLERLVATISA